MHPALDHLRGSEAGRSWLEQLPHVVGQTIASALGDTHVAGHSRIARFEA
jgi:hypothetical protein